MTYRKTASDRAIDALIHVILITAAAACLFPVIHIFAVSLSSAGPASAGEVGLLPVDFSTEAYHFISSKVEFWRAFFVSIRRVALGLIVNLGMAILCAYPLSKSALRFPARASIVSAQRTRCLPAPPSVCFSATPLSGGGGWEPSALVTTPATPPPAPWSL